MEELCQCCGVEYTGGLVDCVVCGNEVCDDCALYIDGDLMGRVECDNCITVES